MSVAALAPRPAAADVAAYVRDRRTHGQPVVFDLGCGGRKVAGAFGVDGVALPGVDLVHDLRARPYPLPAACADRVELNHVIEHLDDPIALMEEVWRIARPGGTVSIRTPHGSGPLAWKDPTHRRAFTSESFRYFGENGYSYYTGARFRVTAVPLQYFMEAQYWPRPLRVWGRLVQRMLDAHPQFCERFLCYWVGGIEELRVTLEAVKPPAGSEA